MRNVLNMLANAHLRIFLLFLADLLDGAVEEAGAILHEAVGVPAHVHAEARPRVVVLLDGGRCPPCSGTAT